MNHEKEAIVEAAIEEATAAVETAVEQAEEGVLAAAEEVMEGVEHTDLDASQEKVVADSETAEPQAEEVDVSEYPTAFLQNLPEQHPLQGRPMPYKKIGDTLVFSETRNGREVELKYEATQVGEQVQYVLKK